MSEERPDKHRQNYQKLPIVKFSIIGDGNAFLGHTRCDSDVAFEHSPHIYVAQVNPALSVTARHVSTETARFEQFCWYNNCRLINTLSSDALNLCSLLLFTF